MVRAISSWRYARSLIGNAGTEETVELDFNIGTREAIEIASIQGIINVSSITEAAAIAPIAVEQSLHIESGTVEALGSAETDADSFELDSEVVYHQSATMASFNGTTEAAAYLVINPAGIVIFAHPILSPINPTHRSDNAAGSSGSACILLIEYRYVSLSDQELALEFARRRR